MTNYWNNLWRRIYAPESKVETEADRLSALQQMAVRRRREHAIVKEQGAPADEALLRASRKRMEEAEIAHTDALQRWNNKQTRQKSY